MFENGKTYFKNLAMWTMHGFKSTFGHFSILSMKRLNYLRFYIVTANDLFLQNDWPKRDV